MAKIVWDKMEKRRVETGVSKGVLYIDGKAVPWNGLTSVTLGSDGAEPVELWSDNIKYSSFRSAETFTATIEAYQYPAEFGKCDGTSPAIPGVYVGQQKRERFNMCYRSENQNANGTIEGSGYKLHLIYNATASPSEKAYQTINDSPDAATFSWELTSNPFVVEKFRPSSIIIINSQEVASYKMKVIEDILYGTENTSPRIPSPNEAMDLVKRLDLHAVFIDVLSVPGHWIWDTFNFKTSTIPSAIQSESERHVFYDPTSQIEYVQPSVVYKYISEGDDNARVYSIDIVDQHDPSEFAEALGERLDMSFISKETIDSFTHYYYTASVY